MKRIGVRLYDYLDPHSTGRVTFRSMLIRVTPGAKREHIDQMMEWVRKEEAIIASLNTNQVTRGNKNVTFKQVKDFLHIFVSLDKDHDFELTYDDLKNKYSHILTDKDIEEYFHRFGKRKTDTLNLEEYLRIMLPKDCMLPDHLVKTEAAEYVKNIALFEMSKVDPKAEKEKKT